MCNTITYPLHLLQQDLECITILLLYMLQRSLPVMAIEWQKVTSHVALELNDYAHLVTALHSNVHVIYFLPLHAL